MKFTCLLIACLAGASQAFVLPSGASNIRTAGPVHQRTLSQPAPLFLETGDGESSSSKASIVPISRENVEFSAGVVGALAGFLIGGPWGAVLLSVASNYGSKQENDVGEGVRGVSKSAIEIFNFLSGLNAKYDISDKTGKALGEAVNKLKEGDETQNVAKVEEILKQTAEKAGKLATEYDLVAKGKQALGVAGELADTAIEKSVELEKEYKVVDKVKDSIAKASQK